MADSELLDCIMYVGTDVIFGSTVASNDLCTEQNWPGNLTQFNKYHIGSIICQQNIDLGVDQRWPKDQHNRHYCSHMLKT